MRGEEGESLTPSLDECDSGIYRLRHSLPKSEDICSHCNMASFPKCDKFVSNSKKENEEMECMCAVIIGLTESLHEEIVPLF